MGHYDGPVFFQHHHDHLDEREEPKWQSSKDDEAYQLPPQRHHQDNESANESGQTPVAGFAELDGDHVTATPRQFYPFTPSQGFDQRRQARPAVDYGLITRALTPQLDSLFLFTDEPVADEPDEGQLAQSDALQQTSETAPIEPHPDPVTVQTEMPARPVTQRPALPHDANVDDNHTEIAIVEATSAAPPGIDERQTVQMQQEKPAAVTANNQEPRRHLDKKAARIAALRQKHEEKKRRQQLAKQSPTADSKQHSVPSWQPDAARAELKSPTPPTPLAPQRAVTPTPDPLIQGSKGVSTIPPVTLLQAPVKAVSADQQTWVMNQADQLDQTLAAFNVDGHVVAHTVGPTVTQFQVALASGVKVNKITNLNDDLKMALAAKDIRIEAPIPGKNTVGIEIPNLKPRPVMLREVLDSPAFQQAASPLTVALGVDLFGQPMVTDLAKMPHGLIAGATGSGKSVFINSLLVSLLYKATPQDVRLLLIDPKAVELAVYNGLPHLVTPVVSDPKAASAALKWVVKTMETRYTRLAAAGARNLAQYNAKATAAHQDAQKMPYLVVIIDELADLMATTGNEIQDDIARITAKARAAGIHLLVATQRPSVDVITGTIKNNIPTRIAFMTASQIDSRTILDTAGAERLLGRGDMLYLGNGASQPIRLQGTFIDEEIDAVVAAVKQKQQTQYLFQADQLQKSAGAALEPNDELMPDVLGYIANEKHVSTSKLQRVFSIGYNRAARLIDLLEAKHYVSAAKGAKPREVYYSAEDYAEDSAKREDRLF